MPIAAFLGPEPGAPPPPRPTRGPNVPVAVNAARRLQLAPPARPRPPVCTIEVDADGQPTPESLERCSLKLPRVAFKPLKVDARTPAPGETPRPRIPEAPFNPSTTTMAFSVESAVGFTFNGGSLPLPFPCRLTAVDIFFGMNPPDALTAGDCEILITNTPQQTSVISDARAGTPIWPLVAGIGITTTGHTEIVRQGAYRYQCSQPIPVYPGFLNLTGVLAIGANEAHIHVFLVLEETTLDDLRRVTVPLFFHSTPSPALAFRPRPPAAFDYRDIDKARNPLSNLGKIEVLAQRLREAPFGIPHTQMVAAAQEAGFGLNAEKAVNLAIRQAAKPPNMQFLASQL